MELIGIPKSRIEYSHRVKYKGIEYLREEILIPKTFSRVGSDKLYDVHNINWRIVPKVGGYNGSKREFSFSSDSGWAMHTHSRGWSNIDIPEIEKEFKETIGKNLVYFQKFTLSIKEK